MQNRNRTYSRHLTRLLTLMLIFIAFPFRAVLAQEVEIRAAKAAFSNAMSIDAPPWWVGYTLILSDVSTPAALHQTVKRIRDAGGRVGVMTEPDVVFGWLPVKNAPVLLAAGATAVFDKEIPSESMAGRHLNTQAAMRFFNSVVKRSISASAPATHGRIRCYSNRTNRFSTSLISTTCGSARSWSKWATPVLPRLESRLITNGAGTRLAPIMRRPTRS